LGVYYREKQRLRIRGISELIDVLELLESEVRYVNATLPECCMRVGTRIEGLLGRAIMQAARLAQEGNCRTDAFPEVFEQEVGHAMEQMQLAQRERAVFLRIVSKQGFGDPEMQKRILQQSRERLNSIKDELMRESVQRERIAVGLGVMGGILLIVVLW
jgi:stage III sporulation protein AB